MRAGRLAARRDQPFLSLARSESSGPHQTFLHLADSSFKSDQRGSGNDVVADIELLDRLDPRHWSDVSVGQAMTNGNLKVKTTTKVMEYDADR